MKLENSSTERENILLRMPISPSKSFKSRLGIIIMLAAITWPFAAIWLHAHQIINNATETLTCWWLCIPAAMIGAAYFCGGRNSPTVWPNALTFLVAIVCGVFAIAIIIGSRSYSGQMFAYWITKRIPHRTWQQMASELEEAARQKLVRHEGTAITAKELPKDFSLLGREDECRDVAIWNDEADLNPFAASVTYGDRNRFWGILIGTRYHEQSKIRRIQVATNVWFFLRDGW